MDGGAGIEGDNCPVYAIFFGTIGASCAAAFTGAGAAYGTAKAATGICQTAILRPELIMKSIIPIVMAGILAIYGLIVAVIIVNGMGDVMHYPLAAGFLHLSAGISVGLCGLVSGFAIGVVGDAGVRGTAHQSRLYVGMILMLIFAEVLGLYGLIVALIMTTKASNAKC